MILTDIVQMKALNQNLRSVNSHHPEMNQYQKHLNTIEETPETELRYYAAVLWREKWGITGLVLVFLLGAFVVAQTMTPIYRSTATLLIEAQSANVVSIEEVYGIDSSQREYFATQFEILNSRELAEKVIRDLELENHAELAPSESTNYFSFSNEVDQLSEEQKWLQTVKRFQNALSIQPIRNTQLVRISFDSAYPELTYRVANALGEAYIENHLESRLALTQKAADWLTVRLGDMQTDLEAAERRLQEFREREDLVDISGVATISTTELEKIQQSLIASRNRTAELRSQHSAVGSLTNYKPTWETLPGVLDDQLTQRLKESEGLASQELSELSQRYGPKHPKRIAAQSKFEGAREAYRRQVTNVVSGFEKSYQQALEDQSELERALERSKLDIQGINRKAYELSQLEREVETNRQLYDLFFTRFKETNTANFEAANARFVDHAVKPYSPVEPRKVIILLVAGFVALVLGIILAFLRDVLDNTIKSSVEIESKLNQPVIGVLPKVDSKKAKNTQLSEVVLGDSDKAFAEAVRTARTGVTLAGLDNPANVLVVTSSVPGEGKTTVSMNLAFGFGQLERVILVDADMRRPTVAQNCGFDNSTPGLSEVIAGSAKLDDCISTYKSIDVITAGAIPPNPLELLSSEKFKNLIMVLADKYDKVIIDSAPTQAVSDSLVLSNLVDGLVYVVKSDSTPTQVIQEGMGRLLRSEGRLLGVVLNQFNPRTLTGYGNYSKAYYEYYG